MLLWIGFLCVVGMTLGTTVGTGPEILAMLLAMGPIGWGRTVANGAAIDIASPHRGCGFEMAVDVRAAGI